MSQYSPLINVMIAAAQKAGRNLIRDFGEVEQLQVSRKGPGDFVTKADKKAEKIIFEELRKARPSYGFLMEENGSIPGNDTSNTWIVDPLDGTTNFLHGIPQFAVSIGLERDGDLFAGVIYEPITDQTYWAENGKGAYQNNRRLRVSARRDMSESLFSTGIPFIGQPAERHAQSQKEIGAVMDKCCGIRRFGAASLDLAWVAAGRYEGFWETGLQPWDMAAGIVMIREAGGFVSDSSGKRNMMKSGSIVAGNDSLHATLLSILQKSAK
ncbi:MAG: inositol monophosphatase [Alphaproteobacteria bacterium]|nr:inositol monophosphatase [Alphaproteobacteria bacterium]MBT4890761.1 inositol monophosphatase [Rhodospirillales bacterium]